MHSVFRFQCNISMARTIAALRRSLSIKRCAEIIAAAAAIYNPQTAHLFGQIGFFLCHQELFQFLSKLWKRIFEYQ